MKKSTKYLKMFLNIIFFIVAAVVTVFVGYKLLIFFMPFVIAWIIAMIANPMVRFLEKRLKILRKHGSMIIIIAAMALIITVGYFGIAKLWQECANFVQSIPETYKVVEKELYEVADKFEGIYGRLPENVQTSISNAGNNLSSYFSSLVSNIGAPTVTAAGNFAKNIPSTLISIVISLLAAYFFIARRDKIMEGYRIYMPQVIQKNLNLVYDNFRNAVGGYFKAQFKIMGIVAVILWVGFLILGINYAILLAILIAILDMLPFFGTGTALIPWALFEVAVSDYKRAVGLVVIYLVSQLVRQIIQPKILGDTMGLDPLLTLFMMFIGYKFKGVIGMIFAVPIGMILINMFKAGVFDNFIKNIRELITDFNNFRRT